MKKKDLLIYLILFLVSLISRIPLVEKIQSHWDGPQYSIAVVRYSLEQFTPAPPGYPLYIMMGNFFYLFLNDPHKAILAISVFGAGFGSVILYLVGKNIYNRSVGIVASIIFLTGSTFYYFGLTAYAYGLLPGTTTLLAYVAYRIFIKQKNEGLLLGLIFGICFGLRPQETLQIGPLALLGFIALPKYEKLKSSFVFILITLLWFIPILYTTGSIQKYYQISHTFAGAAFTSTPLVQHIELMTKGFLLSFGISSIFLIYFTWKLKQWKKIIKDHSKIILFYASWIIPGIFFNLFIRTDHAGYQMSYLSGFIILIAYATWKTMEKNKILYTFILFIIAIFNLSLFLYDRDPNFSKPYRPTSFHYSDIRKNDIKTGSKVNFVKKNFDSKKTIIISTEVLWRPYSYYLKDYPFVVLYGLDNTQAPYRENRIDAINWNMHLYEDKDSTITISNRITSIVLIDDAASDWIKNYPHETFFLPGNSTITSASIEPSSAIQYGYHSLEVNK